MRGGASPFSTNEFSVLKVCVDWLKAQFGGWKFIRPPFGAAAST